MLAPIITIASYTVREALRTRLLWLFVLMAAGALGLGGFLEQLALTESRELHTALLAAALRLGAVGVLAGFVVTSLAREAADKGRELLLALAIPRAAYFLGKLAGFAAVALLPALLFGALMLPLAAPAQAALWAFSLWCELCIIAAFSLLCALSLGQPVAALAASAAFYLLARVIASLQLMSHTAGTAQDWRQQAIAGAVNLLARLLPALDGFSRTDWLLYGGADLHALLVVASQSALYVALLGAAGLFDLYRKNL